MLSFTCSQQIWLLWHIFEVTGIRTKIIIYVFLFPVWADRAFVLVLQGVKKDFSEMQQSVAELRELSKKVALYVCEPMSTFNLQACLQNVLAFLKDLRRARHVRFGYIHPWHLFIITAKYIKNYVSACFMHISHIHECLMCSVWEIVPFQAYTKM